MTYVIRVEPTRRAYMWLRGFDKDKPVLISNKEFKAGRGIQEYVSLRRAEEAVLKIRAYSKNHSVVIVELR